jgi:hypothetical protein
VAKGQARAGTLHLGEDKRWFARFEGDDRRAVITNPSKIPSNTANGAAAQFYIEQQSKAKGIKARFECLLESRRS